MYSEFYNDQKGHNTCTIFVLWPSLRVICSFSLVQFERALLMPLWQSLSDALHLTDGWNISTFFLKWQTCQLRMEQQNQHAETYSEAYFIMMCLDFDQYNHYE